MHDKLLLDCTCLTHLSKLKTLPFFKLGDLVKDHFLIPEYVVIEFEKFCNDQSHLYPTATKLALAIAAERKYRKCPHGEPIIYEELKALVDPGEAEAIAQINRIGANLFISNDLRARKKLIETNYSHIRFFSTFYLIALADVYDILPNYPSAVEEYFSLLMVENMTKSKRLAFFEQMKLEYLEAIRRKGFYPSTKENEAKIKFNKAFNQFLKRKC